MIDTNEKEIIQHPNNLLPYYPKDYALRELKQLYSLTSLKIVQNNSETKLNHHTDVSQDIDIVDDHDDEWIDDQSKPEVEFDDEQQQSYEQNLTNLRVLEWLNEMTSDPKETSVTIQDVDRESINYMKTE